MFWFAKTPLNGSIGVRSCFLAYSGTADQPAHRGAMQADVVSDLLLRLSVLSNGLFDGLVPFLFVTNYFLQE